MVTTSYNLEVAKYRSFISSTKEEDSPDSVVEEAVLVLPEVAAGVERRPAALDDTGALVVELQRGISMRKVWA